MKPVYQDIFPIPGNDLRGNCFQAAVASILELPLEEVPHFCQHDDWEVRLDRWLADRGLAHVEVKTDTEEACIYPIPEGVHCILSGTTPRHPTRLHAVNAITRGGGVTWEFTHDPHPDRSFLNKVTMIMFLVPLDPAKYIRRTGP
jgi:hypothetical protein